MLLRGFKLRNSNKGLYRAYTLDLYLLGIMPLRETIKNTIATYKAVNSVEMTSYLI
jgi:hypothetical protein